MWRNLHFHQKSTFTSMITKSVRLDRDSHNQLSHIQLFLSKEHPLRSYSKKRVLSMAISAFIKKLNEMYKVNSEED